MDLVASQRADKAAVVALLQRISRPSILISHSQGAPAGWLAADACPELVKAIIAVEPNGPPFSGKYPHNGMPARLWGLTDIPMTFSPPVTEHTQFRLVTTQSEVEGKAPKVLQDESEGRIVHELVSLKNISVLIEMGEASYHAGFDHATVAFLRQAGVACDFIELEKLGIRGNGHMQMLELNNLEIAAVLENWLKDKHLT